GGSGLVANGRELGGVRAIQRIHKWIRQRAENKAIDTAPAIVPPVEIEVGIINVGSNVDARLHRELFRRRAAHLQVDSVADSENGVANRFGVEAGAIHAPKKNIPSIKFREFRVVL